MTENEARTLLREHYKTLSLNGSFEETKEINGAISMAIKALEDIQVYRAIGTIEELNDELYALRAAIDFYQSIGSVTECRIASERMKPKKPVGLKKNICPTCSWIVEHEHCEKCGQAILLE